MHYAVLRRRTNDGPMATTKTGKGEGRPQNEPHPYQEPQIDVFDRFLKLGGFKLALIVLYEQGVPLHYCYYY